MLAELRQPKPPHNDEIPTEPSLPVCPNGGAKLCAMLHICEKQLAEARGKARCTIHIQSMGGYRLRRRDLLRHQRRDG